MEMKKPYVKADLTPELNTALEIVSKKLGNSKSTIVTASLEYYFKHLFPESLPKTNDEILEKARSDYLYNETSRVYERTQHMVDAISGLERDIESYKQKIGSNKNRIHLLKKKVLDGIKDAKKRAEIETEIDVLNQSLQNDENQKYIFVKLLENAKKGKVSEY